MIVSKILLYAKVARMQTLFMSLLLILCAFFYSKHHYEITSYKAFIWVGFAVFGFHLSTNTISEYRDCKKGVDDISSSGTKYRLISGIVPKKHILILGITSFILAAISGIVSVFIGSTLLIIPGIIAAGIALFYSEWPFGFKYKALGEVCVFLIYGPLIFSSCILSLTNEISLTDLLFSIPFGLLTANVLLANNIRDYEFEKGKTVTLTIKFGLKFSYFLLFFMTHLAFLVVPFFVYKNIIPNAGFIAFLSYPIIFFSIKKIGKSDFIEVFGILQIAFALLICLSFLI